MAASHKHVAHLASTYCIGLIQKNQSRESRAYLFKGPCNSAGFLRNAVPGGFLRGQAALIKIDEGAKRLISPRIFAK